MVKICLDLFMQIAVKHKLLAKTITKLPGIAEKTYSVIMSLCTILEFFDGQSRLSL